MGGFSCCTTQVIYRAERKNSISTLSFTTQFSWYLKSFLYTLPIKNSHSLQVFAHLLQCQLLLKLRLDVVLGDSSAPLSLLANMLS